jgi:hypothetical protein
MNRRDRAAAIRAQLPIAEADAAGEIDYHCHQCAESALYAGLVGAIEAQQHIPGKRDAVMAMIAAVTLLERPAAPGLH